ELAPVLLHEQREVAVVIRTVAVLRKTAGDRELPVDIDTVEQTGVAAQEDVDRGCDEPLPRGGRCRSVREPARAAPAAERDDQLQVWMTPLEVAQLCEVAAGRAVRMRGALLTHTGVDAGIGECCRTILFDASERVEDVREPVGVDVRDARTLRAHTPPGEVSDDARRRREPGWRLDGERGRIR